MKELRHTSDRSGSRRLPAPAGRPMLLLAAAALLLCRAPSAPAQTSVELLIKPFEPNKPFELTTQGYAVLDGNTDNRQSYSLTIFDLYARYRLNPEWKMDPRLGAQATFMNFDSPDPVIPESLLDASVGVGFGLFDYEGWLGGMTVGIGYAGEAGDAFGDANALYFKASIAAGKKLSPTEAFGIVLDYDGNRTFMPDIPLIGFAWDKLLIGDPDPKNGNRGPRLLMSLGLPFASVEWRPVDRLTLIARYAIPDNFTLRADYDLLGNGKLGLFASYDARRDAFHSNSLKNGIDRILVFQRRAEVGLRWTPATGVNFLLAGGYAFSQELTQGFDARDDDEIADLSDRPYFRLGLEMRF